MLVTLEEIWFHGRAHKVHSHCIISVGDYMYSENQATDAWQFPRPTPNYGDGVPLLSFAFFFHVFQCFRTITTENTLFTLALGVLYSEGIVKGGFRDTLQFARRKSFVCAKQYVLAKNKT